MNKAILIDNTNQLIFAGEVENIRKVDFLVDSTITENKSVEYFKEEFTYKFTLQGYKNDPEYTYVNADNPDWMLHLVDIHTEKTAKTQEKEIMMV